MSKPISYNSEFLPEITIAVVFSDSPQYEKLIPFFEEYGYGFLVPNKNFDPATGYLSLRIPNAKINEAIVKLKENKGSTATIDAGGGVKVTLTLIP